MIDVEKIKANVDCREVVEQDLGKPKVHTAKYNAYKCPLHHEHTGYSLTVTMNSWKCWGKCQIGGDVIAWLQRYRGMTFQEACQALSGYELPTTVSRPRSHPELKLGLPILPPDAVWQANARKIVHKAAEYLWSDSGQAKLDYLRVQRGLSEEIIRCAALGYVPPRIESDLIYGRILIPHWKKPDGKPVRVPCGITIPHFADGHLWALRVRTDFGNPKYVGIAGGKKALYWSDNIQHGLPVMIVEGEFDCLVMAQVAPDLVSAVALGSASNKHIDSRWHGLLLSAPVILARMDADEAGLKALEVLQAISLRVKPIAVPIGKDVNDYYLACKGFNPRMRFQSWINDALWET